MKSFQALLLFVAIYFGDWELELLVSLGKDGVDGSWIGVSWVSGWFIVSPCSNVGSGGVSGVGCTGITGLF
jgi:hypothetical protein